VRKGTMGVVTWTNLKIESIPRMDKVLFAPVEDLELAIQFLHPSCRAGSAKRSCC
jgi:hypothetical protein